MFYFEEIKEGCHILKSDKLSVHHFFTVRDFSLKVKEGNDDIINFQNREYIKNKFNLKSLISPVQTHTTNVFCADINRTEYPDCDGLILKDKDIGIFLNFADCTPVILYDSVQKTGAVIHAGWRGTVGKIVQKGVYTLKSNPKNITAVIGPSICFKCFETSFAIMDKLSNTVKNKDGCIKTIDGKFYADLKEINKRQLLDLGVREVDVAPFCTCCDNDKFFSYRKENKTTERMSAFLSLN